MAEDLKKEVKRKTTTRTTKATATSSAKEAVQAAPVKEVFKPKVFDPNQIVEVRNGTHGTLVYVSKKTSERFIWNGFGDVQDMEVSELRNARNNSKGFFENNWFMFDDPEVVEYLGVGRYYKNALTIDNFDNVFSMTPTDISSTVSKLSEGQKKLVAFRAKQLIATGDIDSNKAIKALEEALGVELIER